VSARDDFIEWAREHAVQPDASDDANAERVGAALEPLLAGTRVVFLGEPDHFIQQKSAYRELFLRVLVPRGWTIVGEEFGWSDGLLIDRYIETGDESLFARVAMFGSKEAERPDRVDAMTGLLKLDDEGANPTEAFRSHGIAQARLLRALSEARPSGAPRVRYFGFDVDATPGGAYPHIEEALRVLGTSAASRLWERVARVPGETLSEEARRIDGVLNDEEIVGSARDDAAGAAAGDVRYMLETLRDNLAYAALVYPATEWADIARGMAMRERVMQRHCGRALARADGAGVVLMGHNAHLAKESTRIRLQGIGPGGGEEVAVGTWLARRMPGAVLAVWMLFERGSDCQPLPSLPRELASPPDSLNAVLAQVGDAYVLPLEAGGKRQNELASRSDVYMMYNQPAQLALAEQADVLCFVREVSPLVA
jgi:erythromycin esterase-like protein